MSERDEGKPGATPPSEAGAGGADEEAAKRAADSPAPSEDEAARKAAAAAEARARQEAAARAKAEAEAAKPPWERDPVVPSWQEADADPLAVAVREVHGETLVSARTFAGDLVLEVAPGELSEVAADLKERHGYRLLVDVCGAHYPKREQGAYEVVYHLYCFEDNRRVRLKVRTDDGVPVPTVSAVWKGAEWPEREAWDMYGIRFSGHPDPTRILMWEGFNGHPLRKDFPVEGIDTGSAIYPEYYEQDAGPVAGTGTGWKPPEPPQEETEGAAETADESP